MLSHGVFVFFMILLLHFKIIELIYFETTLLLIYLFCNTNVDNHCWFLCLKERVRQYSLFQIIIIIIILRWDKLSNLSWKQIRLVLKSCGNPETLLPPQAPSVVRDADQSQSRAISKPTNRGAERHFEILWWHGRSSRLSRFSWPCTSTAWIRLIPRISTINALWYTHNYGWFVPYVSKNCLFLSKQMLFINFSDWIIFSKNFLPTVVFVSFSFFVPEAIV